MLEYLHLDAWSRDSLLPVADRYHAQTILPARLRHSKDDQVITSNFHSFHLHANGSLYACGVNGYGQLGTCNNARLNTFTLVPVPEAVQMVKTSIYHTLLLTVSGRVYACGKLEFQEFTLITTPGPVRNIEAGDSHIFVTTVSGDLYACGDNSYEQLGLGHHHKQSDGFVLVPK